MLIEVTKWGFVYLDTSLWLIIDWAEKLNIKREKNRIEWKKERKERKSDALYHTISSFDQICLELIFPLRHHPITYNIQIHHAAEQPNTQVTSGVFFYPSSSLSMQSHPSILSSLFPLFMYRNILLSLSKERTLFSLHIYVCLERCIFLILTFVNSILAQFKVYCLTAICKKHISLNC